MINGDETVKKRNSLVNITVRSIFVVFSVLTAMILLFSYQISTRAVNQEMLRNMHQTSSLLQNLFDTHLAQGKHLQNNIAGNTALQQYLVRHEEKRLDGYFLHLEKTDTNMVFDFHFITRQHHILWDDGNAPFFGLHEAELEQLSKGVTFYNKWHYVRAGTGERAIHLLVRRVPVVDERSGEILGKLYGGIVLNNNLALLEQFKIASDVSHVILTVGNLPVASTGEISDNFIAALNSSSEFRSPLDNKYLYSRTPLYIAGAETPLLVYAMQDNANILSLEYNYQISLLFYVVSVFLAALLARFLIQKRVAGELSGLMQLAQGCSYDKKSMTYSGSKIKEFNHIGRTLEKTFNDLRDKERSFQDLFNFSLSPIIVWDSQGEVIRMNPAAERIFDRHGEFYSEEFLSFQSKIRPQLSMINEGASITGMNISVFETIYRWNLSPIDLEGGVHSIITQGQDITTLIEAEQQSNLARMEAEKSAKARADFLAKMSHEIRTPLNGILGISQLLKQSVTQPDQSEKVDVLCQSGEHLLTVLNDILDFSRLEQGKFNIVFSPFSFTSLISSVDSIYRPLCREKDLEFIIINTVDEHIYLNNDKVRLNQIMHNLLSNAVKFTHKGRVSVQFELIDNAADFVSEEETEAQLKCLNITVGDTGIGISSEKLESIFEPFEQSEKTTTREYGGSGLGLTIVKHLVALLGGTIRVRSLVGTGSQFILSIPVELVDEPQEDSVHYGQTNYRDLFDRSLSLLLVEDNRTNAFIARAFCEKYAMHVDWAEDGLVALDKLKTHQYDVILMDNQMPNLDGVEATQIIRRNLKLTTPVFACTADGYELTRNEFLNAGADYVIVKPIKEQALYEAFCYLKERFLLSQE
ncbi:ATPase [Vibrio sp. HA2012]|uniref:LuxQ periplasmic sensor domain-containing protein n=1 Tax=Vibrio sp. HA2012 TaxID=1971595 RepID=UPI000C2BCA93|nr:LuxQ periplasmic sensor domain-containing protein [Vibrio sp. HA2012]PJC87363.1 ATPase [Vibrio sp. HA2012]